MSRLTALPSVAAALLLASCTKSGAPAVTSHYLTIADGTGDVPTFNPHLFTETTLGYISQSVAGVPREVRRAEPAVSRTGDGRFQR